MIEIRPTAVALAVLLITASSCEKNADPPPTGPRQGHRIEFGEDGRLARPSNSVVDAIVADAASATDVFIFSHGWWNSPGTAECRYAQMIDGMTALARMRRPQEFRAVLVGIYWPSAIFPPAKGDCEEVTGDVPESTVAPSVFVHRVKEWAGAAFPTAAARPTFGTERARAAELLTREREGVRLSKAEGEELVRILVAWRDAGGNRTAPVDVGESLFDGDAATLIERWRGPEAAATGESERESAAPSRWLDWANVFTFWVMKDRAGIVGSRGVYDVLQRLQAYRRQGLRIHLIGHSFGGKLVTAAITGDRRGPPNTVDSLVLLQAAFSHFALSTAEQIRAVGVETSLSGAYASVMSDQLVAGPIVVTYSSQDRANQFWYPRGVVVSNDFLERAAVSKFGSLGADGLQGPVVNTIILGRDSLADRVGTGGRWHFNADGSTVIRGHSDLAKPEVFDLIWDAAIAARRWRGPAQ